MKQEEKCSMCGCKTGINHPKCSLYFGDDGPLCVDCFDYMKARLCEKWATNKGRIGDKIGE